MRQDTIPNRPKADFSVAIKIFIQHGYRIDYDIRNLSPQNENFLSRMGMCDSLLEEAANSKPPMKYLCRGIVSHK